MARGQGHPAAQHGARVGLDAVEEAVVDAGHGGDAGGGAAVEHGQQAGALGEQFAGAADLEADQAGEVAVGAGAHELGPLGAAELPQVLGGQVDAAVRGILTDVAEDVGDLEGQSEGVGVLGGAGRIACAGQDAEDAEGQTADGAGHAGAVGAQLVPGLVGVAADVHQHAVDQLVEGAEREGVAVGRVGEGDGDRVGVVLGNRTVADACQQGAGRGQPFLLGAGVQPAVPDVVHAPGEGVHGGEGPALRRGHEPGAVAEVPRVLFGDAEAVLVGGDDRGRQG